LTNATPTNWQAGLSPHAPYTAGWSLVESVVKLSRRFQAPVAMHLAETCEELEFLNSHSGPLLDLLDQRGVWDASAVPRGIQPIDYLKLLSTAHRALIIHGNYLVPADWNFLAKHAHRMSVVYCPRTFHYFGHRAYPLESMLAAGVHLAIGTDSRASNPNLNLFEELKFIRRQHPSVSPRQLLELGTENGAAALGMKIQALKAIDLPNQERADPFALLFDS
jgi:cytosine/adenosine deaminase-related metal-dependent hydrolase